ncbi:DinB family protein [Mucilaginibacter psychrotolerans]|uniref:DinB family protein n=1 Tax=Mucilaginibacter psychrotolerans TaxID=1524096 RepID=A0A4Y8S8H4_9SPHI|nr:DinB family protein [Mucilaginibacter psychrotolerans]TFF34935.1 DinB family protein [Mucilaginibacter psychrotolerans]
MPDIAERLNQAIDDFFEDRSPHVDWENSVLPGKWNNKEIIGHLIDSAHINLQRFVRCTYEERFKLIYYQDEWVKAQHYADADPQELLLLWKLVNKQIVRVLANYPADRWLVTCDNNMGQPVYNTVAFIAEDYVAHMQHHLNQLK